MERPRGTTQWRAKESLQTTSGPEYALSAWHKVKVAGAGTKATRQPFPKEPRVASGTQLAFAVVP